MGIPKETLDLLRPSNAIGENITPFNDFVGDCAHLFEEDTFKERFSNLISKECGSQENIVRVLIDNYQFGDMIRVFDETDEEYVVQWEFE